ncbi:MAG: thioredoxin domain-containing protein, partial [Balneolaceae bacterium]
CQMLTGQGGWPLTILMTPEKKPFFAATYIPKETMHNRMGMLDLIPQIEQAWKNRRDQIEESTGKILDSFSKTLELTKSGSKTDDNITEKAFLELKNRYDQEYGGFGTAPKFPSPHTLIFLMHFSKTMRNEDALEMSQHTLKQMRYGGIYDHIGCGFHRYSTDRHWLLPHFEKMLYDQAMLIQAYTLGWQHSKNALFKNTVYEITGYLKKHLLSEEGGFYSAEDADSDGEEGKFYVWSVDEIRNILSSDEAEHFLKLYNFQKEGNFRDEATGQNTGNNIPYLSDAPASNDIKISNILKKLEKTREQRIRPLLDDKILTDWNGLIIASLSRAGSAFQDQQLITLAEKAWAFLQARLMTENGNLLHRYKNGDAGIEGMADDYAFCIWGLIELYLATFKINYLELAITLHGVFEENFRDKDYGGYFFTHKNSDELLGRQKEIYDGALPSSNSVQIMNSLRLSRLTGDTSLERKALLDFQAFANQINHSPSGFTHALQALFIAEGHSFEIVLTQEKQDENLKQFLNVISEKPLVEPSIHIKTDKNRKQLSKMAPYTADHKIETTPAVYLCKNFTCNFPVKDLTRLREKL